jgi:hypothetical protein
MQTCLSAVVALAVAFVPSHALAQASGTAARLAHAEGDVYLDERAVESNAAPLVLPDDAVVRTSQGRAAIALKRGGWLLLDARTSVRVLRNGVYNFNRIEVLTGSAIVASETSSPQVVCENDTSLSDAGVFRFDVQHATSTGERSCQLRVFEGGAGVPLVSVYSVLRAGQAMTCNRRCGDMIPTREFSRDQLDDFDRWARDLRARLKK